ncbi:hypothetical protein K7395_12035 [Streptomyces filamentosus]|uniref:LPXTG cell wall anchor domain-containing protein n=2 Tax=Streptomyces filamentosus TaxID=67294 RepID=A0ABY4UT46_STRFL|nr:MULTISPECIES: hypothetical protein [Streptomyces]MYR81091.1 hypothetical protein [Streptomyces sp. SID5466]EFE77140.1 predicted protein [Streptomyces filamentosus NRRL 15998]ESU51500.1 hypothetical protein P376_0526 [Streptomyces sp. HCCB10043]EWS94094.1 hypothetical protein SSIG_04716 [Streptomyces filamentosus NRRL 11379]USC47426.1 hypothetical protein K7395_12035 [Streptomyces filamentosus]
MSVARRTLLTATAAGTLLAALWFVPSANATGENAGQQGGPAAASDRTAGKADDASEARLADTGPGLDTTPYLIGGTALLGIGAGFVTYSVRRSGTRSAY